MYYVTSTNGKKYGFDCQTPLQAMNCMLYTLGAKGVKINKTESGLHLWFEYNNTLYCVRNDVRNKDE